MTAAIPVGLLLRAIEEAIEEEDYRSVLNYDKLPAWLMLAFGLEAAAFGVLYKAGPAATSLNTTHWVLASCASICALRHNQRMSKSPPRQATASMLAFTVAFLVIAGFRYGSYSD